ncbi:hypothetical protein AB6N23_17515, partial [Cellulomonas sp. 179-A 9B4 NHS]
VCVGWAGFFLSAPAGGGGGGAAGDVATSLAALGVADVLVPAPGADDAGTREARARLVGTLDATAGLERVTHDGAGTLWRVRPTDGDVVAAWARIVPAPGGATDLDDLAVDAQVVPSARRAVDVDVPAGDADRVLVLAERADAGWSARLDGRRLEPVEAGWRQAFAVGTDGGRLEVRYDAPGRTPWLVALGLTTLVTVLLALPLRRRRGVRT